MFFIGAAVVVLSGGIGRSASTKSSEGSVALQTSQPGKVAYVPGEVLVKFRSDASSLSASSLHKDVGASMIRTFSSLDVQHMKLSKDMTVEDAVAYYQRSGAVEYAEPNYIYHATSIPNDTSFGQLWGLNNTGQTVNNTAGTPDADIDAPEAWDITTGSANVIIAVVDSGVAYDHPDLLPNMWTNPGETPNDGIDNDGNGFVDDVYGADFVMSDGDPMDLAEHGTHVAGTIAAKGNNASGITGVMQTARIMAVRVLNASGSGTTADIAAGIQYAVAKGAKVINASFGGSGCSLTQYNAISAANNAGVLFVAAAGNETNDNDVTLSFPAGFTVQQNCGGTTTAALSNVIAVAAVDQNDQLASFSNYGATTVQVAAPGTNIYSTKPTTNTISILDERFDVSASLPAGWTH